MILGQIELWSKPLTGVYTPAVIVAAIVVPVIAITIAVQRHVRMRQATVAMSLLVATTLVGARLLHGLTNPSVYADNPSELVSMDIRSFALFGGLLLAGIVGACYCVAARIDVWTLADCTAPALGIGIVIARVGCFSNGCCFGVTTNLPWGVLYPAGSPPHLHQAASDFGVLFGEATPVHPTQVYEMFAALTAALVSGFLMSRRSVPSGVPFLTAVLLFATFRWFNDALRVHASTLVTDPWNYRQLYAIVVMTAAATLAWRIVRRERCKSSLSDIQGRPKSAFKQ